MAGFISIGSVDLEDSQTSPGPAVSADRPNKRYYTDDTQKAVSTAAGAGPVTERAGFVEWHERHLNDNRQDETGWLAFAMAHLLKGQGSIVSSMHLCMQ